MLDVLLVAEAPGGPHPASLAVGYAVLLLLAASCAVWAWAAAGWRRGRSPIPRDARVAVPWRFVEVFAVIGLVLALTIAGAVMTPERDDSPAADGLAREMLASAAFYAVIAAFVTAILVFGRGATVRDLGLPVKLPDDVVYGCLGWLAALAPVYGLQILLVKLVENDRQTHPLIEMLMRDRRLDLLAVAVLMAVVVAPLVEEFLFRVLLQGWLEKWFGQTDIIHAAVAAPGELTHDGEDGGGGSIWAAKVVDDEANSLAASAEPHREPPLPPGYADDAANRFAAPQSDLGDRTQPNSLADGESGLRGAAPVVISSALFAAAHAGTWPDPLPLFVLALVLGYLYRQTHRLWPSVLMHMLFNGLSLAMVWLGVA